MNSRAAIPVIQSGSGLLFKRMKISMEQILSSKRRELLCVH
jgi:hypothetical protein